ncbi:MAG TPA: poly-gamma-glutamate synthase PgsB, partial [candidate division Zixibacteria bacterium]|nr:poly-gamma-glutamate synthase PgsB [candidate division Zixibacteria bacterium]
LQPDYQEISERKIIRSTIDVITNARPDHLEVMGPTDEDVVLALCGTISSGNVCFTAERKRFDIIQKYAEKLGGRAVLAEAESIAEQDMAGFRYIEHEENVALALAVAGHLGIPRETAIRGMWKAAPDIGALTVHRVEFFGKETTLYNAFAANDPESTELLWRKLGFAPDEERPLIVLANNRADRAGRTAQLAKMLAEKLIANYYLLVGTNTKLLAEELARAGMDETLVDDLGGADVAEIFGRCMELTPRHSVIVGVGNIGGAGRDILAYFEARTARPPAHDDSADGV